MGIESRVGRIERNLDAGQDHGPFILVLSARSHGDDPEYEARLNRRIAERLEQRQ